jgi:hypothetical protein
MSTKYTPGKWEAKNGLISPVGKMKTIASVNSYGFTEEEFKANCNVLGAGPELIEALKDIAGELFYQLTIRHTPEQARKNPALIKAETALAKAVGEKEFTK